MEDDIKLLNIKFEEISKHNNSKLEQSNEVNSILLNSKINSHELLKLHKGKLLNLNIGGKLFKAPLEDLLSIDNNLFQFILTKDTDISQEIFIDRSPKVFSYILDYYRNKKVNIKALKQKLLFTQYLSEANFYGIHLNSSIDNSIIKMQISGAYNMQTQGIQDHTILSNSDLNYAILTNSPGWMILEYDKEFETNIIEIGGYTGDQAWVNEAGYGSGGNISGSIDGKTWKVIGTLPHGFGF